MDAEHRADPSSRAARTQSPCRERNWTIGVTISTPGPRRSSSRRDAGRSPSRSSMRSAVAASARLARGKRLKRGRERALHPRRQRGERAGAQPGAVTVRRVEVAQVVLAGLEQPAQPGTRPEGRRRQELVAQRAELLAQPLDQRPGRRRRPRACAPRRPPSCRLRELPALEARARSCERRPGCASGTAPPGAGRSERLSSAHEETVVGASCARGRARRRARAARNPKPPRRAATSPPRFRSSSTITDRTAPDASRRSPPPSTSGSPPSTSSFRWSGGGGRSAKRRHRADRRAP